MYSKRELRKEKLGIRRAIPTIEIDRMSSIIVEKLKDFIGEEMIGLFHPIKNEVNLLELLEKNVAFPRIIDEMDFYKYTGEFVPGKFNIPEPTGDITEVKTIIVPGSVFDYNGYRIGYGGGYYDKYLKKNHLKIGVCFEFQLVDKLPIEKHDVRLDILVTEKNIYRW